VIAAAQRPCHKLLQTNYLRSCGTFNVPVHIQGEFRHPTVSLNATETAARAGASVALGVLLTPLAALLPLLDPGSSAPQPACAQLINQAQKPASKGGGGSD
jgi:hypothetical protein